MKYEWFKYLLSSLALTTVLELIAVITHQYTISDFVLTHVSLKWRFVFCAWLLFHFIIEYWGVYK
jgi:hypothetical protein